MRYNFSGFTEKANDALNQAINSASMLGHTYVGSEHLLLGLLRIGSGVAANVLIKFNVTAESIEELIAINIGTGTPTKLSPDYFTPRAKNVLEVAMRTAANMGKKYIGTEHILIGILSEKDNFAIRFLKELGSDLPSITQDTLEFSGANMQDISNINNKNINNKQTKNVKIETLEKFGRDLTVEAQKGKIDPVIGRQAEVERIIQILCRRTKNNPCLIGEPGVGKTAIIEGLAERIVDGNVPEILLDKRIFTLDLNSMVAGTKYRGDFEERIKAVVDEVKNSDDIILFIDEIHTIIGAGSAEGSTDAANILKPFAAALVCGGSAYLFVWFFGASIVATILAIMFAAIVYAVMVLLLKLVTFDELLNKSTEPHMVVIFKKIIDFLIGATIVLGILYLSIFI